MALRVECACGTTFETPHGEDDFVEFVQWHVGRVHPDMYPDGISREDAMEMAKTV